jgi:hypothetical protein
MDNVPAEADLVPAKVDKVVVLADPAVLEVTSSRSSRKGRRKEASRK